MKMLKVTNDVHRAVKVKAAESDRTAATLASQLLAHSLGEVEAGRLRLDSIGEDIEEFAAGITAKKAGKRKAAK